MSFADQPTHPLGRLFTKLVARELGTDTRIASCVANILVDVTHVDETLLDSKRQGQTPRRRGRDATSPPARSWPRHRSTASVKSANILEICTLFMTGLFLQYVAALAGRGIRLDSVVDYVKARKESYRVVAVFDQFEYRHAAPLFRRLSAKFEYCVYINRVKTRWILSISVVAPRAM